MDPIAVAGVASAVGSAAAWGIPAWLGTPSLLGVREDKHAKGICGGCHPEPCCRPRQAEGCMRASVGRQEAVA